MASPQRDAVQPEAFLKLNPDCLRFSPVYQ